MADDKPALIDEREKTFPFILVMIKSLDDYYPIVRGIKRGFGGNAIITFPREDKDGYHFGVRFKDNEPKVRGEFPHIALQHRRE